MTQWQKPLPVISEDTRPFWEGCRRHQLLIQRCKRCDTIQWFPRGMCRECMSTELEWQKASGKGEIYTYSVLYRPASPAFTDDVPYVVAIVELEEGVRIESNIVQCPVEQVRIGMKVEVVFEDLSDEVSLPKFKPRPSG